jgi:hypothetical protein
MKGIADADTKYAKMIKSLSNECFVKVFLWGWRPFGCNALRPGDPTGAGKADIVLTSGFASTTSLS